MPKNPEIKKVLVIGSGPIVIGQAAEFDYAGTQACRSLKEEGIEVVLLNSNPATIMTDKDIADRVYIEPLTTEVVEQLIKKEKPDSVLPTLGGQAGLNLAMELEEAGILKANNVRLIGTTALTIKKAEDREMFKETMEKIGEPVAPSEIVEDVNTGLAVAKEIGYPVVLRPAYTLGGSGGGIAYNEEQCAEILENGLRLSRVGQVLVERCIAGWKEIEYEVMRDGAGNVITVCNMENIDPVGVHTGDSISVYPAKSITEDNKKTIVEYTEKLARALHVKGMINIQFIVNDEGVFIIEVNPRSSRTVPYISKVTGIPIVPLATQIICGHTIRELGYTPGLQKEADYYAVKMPVFSFEKIRGADISLGPEMKSTGECLGIAKTFNEALYKAFQGAGIKLPKYKNMVMTVRDSDKEEMLDIAARFKAQGYRIFCTAGTAKYFNEHGVKVIPVRKIEQESPNLLDLILGHEIDLVIDIPAQGAERSHDGFIIRRNAIETGVTVLTAVDTARALVTSMENRAKELTLINIAEI